MLTFGACAAAAMAGAWNGGAARCTPDAPDSPLQRLPRTLPRAFSLRKPTMSGLLVSAHVCSVEAHAWDGGWWRAACPCRR